MMPVKKWSNGRGALVLIATLFAVSVIIRLAGGSGQAIAREVAEFGLDADAPHDAELCEISEGAAELAHDLIAREQTVRQREIRLQEFEQSLLVAETAVRKQLAELAEAETRLSATIAQADTAAEDDLSTLTSVYENMKPGEAAKLFEEMETTFAAGFVGRMRPESAAAIMAGLSPQRAYAISVVLAGRNAKMGDAAAPLQKN